LKLEVLEVRGSILRAQSLGVFGSQTEDTKGFGFEVMRVFGSYSPKI
jgi:hypothetical protein